MNKICLDACIWISYVWQEYFADSAKKETASTKLVRKIKGDDNFEIVLTPFLISEISSHFRDWFILQKIIKDGFSYRELNQEKKNYNLSKEEISKLDEIIISIGGYSSVNTLPSSNLRKEEIENILNFEVLYYFDFYDAIHIYMALKEECKHFITTDSPLRKCAASLHKQTSFKIDCLAPSSYLKRI